MPVNIYLAQVTPLRYTEREREREIQWFAKKKGLKQLGFCFSSVSYIKQEECSPRGQSAQAEGLLSRAQYEGVVRGETHTQRERELYYTRTINSCSIDGVFLKYNFTPALTLTLPTV